MPTTIDQPTIPELDEALDALNADRLRALFESAHDTPRPVGSKEKRLEAARKWKREHPMGDSKQHIARRAAWGALERAHPAEFNALLDVERAKLGLGPIRRYRRAVEPSERVGDGNEGIIGNVTPEACAHPDAIRQVLPYGTFCGGCNIKLG